MPSGCGAGAQSECRWRRRLGRGPAGGARSAGRIDAIGNRRSQTKTDLNDNTVQAAYIYTSANRLDHTTAGSQTESFQYNAAGLMTSDARGGYQYAPNNLQKEADLVAGATYYYLYNADGQRISGRPRGTTRRPPTICTGRWAC
jgi:uncharacterized protein RhaS with RHS repeats